MELESPVSFFTGLMYFPTFYPVNRAFVESCGDSFATSPETVLSCGAFVLTSYEPAATSFTLAKNEAYYDADRVQLAGLTYQVIKDSQTSLLSYQNGDLDVVTLSGDQVELVEDDPEFTIVNAGYLWYITVNSKDVEELNNINFRKALAGAFDRVAICASIIKDGSSPAYFAVPEQLATGPDGLDFRASAPVYTGFDKESALAFYNAACEELGKSEFALTLLVEDDATAQNIAAFIQQEMDEHPARRYRRAEGGNQKTAHSGHPDLQLQHLPDPVGPGLRRPDDLSGHVDHQQLQQLRLLEQCRV